MQDNRNCTDEGRALYTTAKEHVFTPTQVRDAQAAVLEASGAKPDEVSRIYWHRRPLSGD